MTTDNKTLAYAVEEALGWRDGMRDEQLDNLLVMAMDVLNSGAATLADVQPGGRVRLGDGLRSELLDQAERLERMAAQDRETGESIEQALEAGEEYTPDDAPDVAAGLQHDANRSEEIAALLRKAAAALSAQPSPGGQDARAQFEEYRGGDCERDAQGYYVNSRTAQDWAVWQAALASRQPVGEPVAYWLAVDKDGIVEFGMSADDGNEGQAARQEVNDFINGALHDGGVAHRLVGVYTAPPAQAVYLGQFRASVLHAYEETHDGYHSEKLSGLLALIDSQAVGNR